MSKVRAGSGWGVLAVLEKSAGKKALGRPGRPKS